MEDLKKEAQKLLDEKLREYKIDFIARLLIDLKDAKMKIKQIEKNINEVEELTELPPENMWYLSKGDGVSVK